MWKLDDFQIVGLLGLQQLLAQLPKLSLLPEHDCELDSYKQYTHLGHSLMYEREQLFLFGM